MKKIEKYIVLYMMMFMKDFGKQVIKMNFDEMTLKEIREMDLKNCRKFLEENKDLLHYDKESEAWFIDDNEIVDELYYDIYTIIHPKEIIGYVEEIIENEMKIPKTNQSLYW